MGSRRSRFAVLAGAVLVLAACGDITIVGDDDAILGSGRIVSETREVTGFDQVDIVSSGDVIVGVTGEDSLVIEADDNLLPLLTSTVSDGRLVLGVRPNTSISPSQEVVYRITAAELVGFVVLGSGNVTITDLHSDEFSVTVLGSAMIDLAGTADVLRVSLPGSGTIDASRLDAVKAVVSINGSGSVTVDASDELEGSINGSGTIAYLGTPTVRQSINGSGSVGPA